MCKFGEQPIASVIPVEQEQEQEKGKKGNGPSLINLSHNMDTYLPCSVLP